MRIGNRIFRNIRRSTPFVFVAKYKNHEIEIHKEKRRRAEMMDSYDIVVSGPGGGYAVNTWEYANNINEAIEIACKGACL